MAVKFSQFTEATDASTITKIVGYTATGSLNVQIPPANLDTTYVVSTTSGAAPVVNLTATKTGGTATSSLLNFTGSGGTTLTGTAGTSTIDISSVDTNTTYTLPAGGTSSAATLTLTGSDSSSDIVTLTGGTGITFSSITDGGFTIDGASGGVDSFQQASGTATSIEPLTITGTASGGAFTGNVSIAANEFGGGNYVGTVPSASGAGDNTKFLKGDGSWTAALELAGGTMTGVIDMGDDKITNLTDPTAAQDAATKFYVDSSAVGALIYQGAYDATVAPPTGVAVLKGFTYTVTVEGNGSGFWSTILRVGDVIIAEQDNPTTEANWTEVQNNIDIASATIPGIVKFPTGNNQIDIAVDGGATAKIFGNGGDITGGYVPNSTSANLGQYLDKNGSWSDNAVSVSAESIEPITDAISTNRSMNIGTNIAGAVSVNTFKFSGVDKPGSVVSNNASNNTLFLKGDGSWAAPDAGGYTTEVVAAATTVSAIKNYLYILTNPSTVTITLPASPADGDTIGIANNFVSSGGNVTNKLVAPGSTGNTDKIMGATTDLVIDNGSAAFDLVFSSAGAPTGNGWTIVGAN